MAVQSVQITGGKWQLNHAIDISEIDKVRRNVQKREWLSIP